MSMKESLSGISTELGKILQQLRDIESVQGRLSKSAGSYSRALAGSGAGPTSIGGSGFSTPPAAPGSNAGGITPTATGSAAPGKEQGGSGVGGAVAAAVGSLFTAGFNFLPSTQDAVTYQSAFFRSSFMGQGGYKEDDLAKMRAMFGNRQTDPFGMVTAANMATMSGMGMGTSHFGTVMSQTATTSMLFGQSNATAAQAQTSLYSGPTAGRLGNIGIFVSSLDTGNPRAFGDIIDQIWQRAYGNSNAKIPYESVMADLRGGYLGAWLRRNFGDNPALYDQLYQALVLKANANGRSLDYSDLTGNGSQGTSGTGPMSAMGTGRSLGLSEENDPTYFAARGFAAQARAIEGGMDELLGAWSASMDKLINATDKYADAMLEGNWLLEGITWAKGLAQTVFGNDTMGPLAGGLFSLLGGGLLGGIKGLFAKGGEGTSTSDSILARLSKGEYVINARAAQEIGVERLDALNSVGHNFGSGFASPARSFSKGGIAEYGYTKHTIPGTVAGATAGQPTLDGWSALNYGDPALKKFPVAGAPNFPNGGMVLLERDGIGQYLADFAGAYQAHPALGGGRLNLNQGASYGHALRAGAMGGGASNHAAGVAMDLRHDPAGFPFRRYEYTASKEEKDAIESLLQRFSKIEWGGHWNSGSIDEMHFEIRDPKTWGKGGHTPGESGAGPEGTPVDETPDPVMRSNGSAGVLALVTSMLSMTSVSGFAGLSGGAPSLGLRPGVFSWFGTSKAKGLLLGTGSGGTQEEQEDGEGGLLGNTTAPSSDASTTSHPDPGTGAGQQWLYNFLVSKGLRGPELKTLWVIGTRESQGNPNLVAAMNRGRFEYPNVPDDFNPSSETWRGGRYDVGMFQINSQHHNLVKSLFGGDMLQMIDPHKNFDMMKHLSKNFSSWTPWGITNATASGFNYINWSTWDKAGSNMWATTWGPATEANDAGYLKDYDKINTHNYSEGAYRTHEGMAKIHEGEMVLPANVAERFREMMRDAGGPQSRTHGDVNITLKIERASDEEAERFARKVKKLLEQDSWETAMRTR